MIKSKKLYKFKNIKHYFFNSIGGFSNGVYKSLNCGIGSNDKKENVNKNLNIVKKKIGVKNSNLLLMKQYHSDKFFIIKSNLKKKLFGDGMITKKRGLALGVLTADCAPILFYDKEKKIIGVAHVGWKGAYKSLIIKMLSSLLKKGSKKTNIIVIIGPCISSLNYEVKQDFLKKFIKKNKENLYFFKKNKNKFYFDLANYIKSQILSIGIKNIEIIKKDTFRASNNFFSHRRAKKLNFDDYGRNISIIMIK